MAIPVRLHSGNFDFSTAKADGSDLRAVAADDKTPLKMHIERFDAGNELAVVWVQVPSVQPGTDKNTVFIYAGNDKAPAAQDDGASVLDGATSAAFHFAEADGSADDATGTIKAVAPVASERNGLIGPSAHLDGTAAAWAASDKLKFAAGSPLTVSLWLKPDKADGTIYAQGPLVASLDGGQLSVKLGSTSVAGGAVAPLTWSHVAIVVGNGHLVAYVNGEQTGQGDLPATTAAIEGDIKLGDGYHGLADELEIASSARSADWIRLAFAAQSADAKLIASRTDTQDTADAGSSSPGYMTILVSNLTPDAWAVIGILFVMFLISAYVMVDKAMFVTRTDKANNGFLKRFRDAKDLLQAPSAKKKAATVNDYPSSSVYRLYNAGMRELGKRDISGDRRLSGASLDAIKASIDAELVRENFRLNSKMVLLTIAIAGGPFLGLLGTVVGVMITFAAIAAAGDVNVNAIAPGIAAALLATVAGLTVAIPSLFGYNYLSSRIKIISSDMQIFVDEFVTRAAELYGA